MTLSREGRRSKVELGKENLYFLPLAVPYRGFFELSNTLIWYLKNARPFNLSPIPTTYHRVGEKKCGERRSGGAEELKKRELIIFGYKAQEIPPKISPHPLTPTIYHLPHITYHLTSTT